MTNRHFCEQCGNEFKSYNRTARFCSRQCLTEHRRFDAEGDNPNMRYQLKTRYGLDYDDFLRWFEGIGEKCLCCHGLLNVGINCHIDHDHETGKIRGILCRKCNTGIGMLGDTVAGVQQALRYLWQSEQAS